MDSFGYFQGCYLGSFFRQKPERAYTFPGYESSIVPEIFYNN